MTTRGHIKDIEEEEEAAAGDNSDHVMDDDDEQGDRDSETVELIPHNHPVVKGMTLSGNNSTSITNSTISAIK